MRVLVVKLSSIGDVVHAVGSAAALTTAWPDTTVDWLVDTPSAPIVRALGFVDEVITLDRVGTTARRLRERRYDLAVDLQGLLRSSVWTVLSGASRRIGRGRWPWLHDSVSMPRTAATPHAIENTARALGPLGIAPETAAEKGAAAFEALAPRLRARGDELMRSLGLAGPLRVWIPQARWPSKAIPSSLIGRAADGMTEVAVGGADLRGRVPSGVADLAGRLDLLDSAALCLAAREVVASDTGPAHLAAALGAHIVGCHGPTRPAWTGLRGPRAISVGASCGGCLRRRCPRAATCMGETVAQGLATLAR